VSLRRVLGIAAVALVTLAGASGCGGGESPSATPSGTPTSTTPSDSPRSAEPEPGEPSVTALQKPKAAETIKPTGNLTSVPGASELPAPREAPRTIQGFPVPPGSKVTDPGAIDQTWQFDIHTGDPDAVIAFYKRVLPQMGYTVRTDVTYTLGYEKVHWDLAFDGKVSGTIANDKRNGVVFVVVNPPGQKAIAGE